jgi:uncharacterized protein with ATP-grasp and redox domains
MDARATMKATEECRPCLARLVRQAADLATEDPELKDRATQAGLECLDREFSVQKTSIEASTRLHRVVRSVTGNADPYLAMKEAEVVMARELRGDRGGRSDSDLGALLVLAVRGNSIDFFKDVEELTSDLAVPVDFAIDQVARFEERAALAGNILFLADNTGEVLFDLPLVRRLGESAAVTYVVKDSPVQNDVTLSDIDRFGLGKDLPRVISTGTDTPGVLMDMASDEFRDEFDAAELVLAKGMGYWETLSELPPRGNVFHLLKAKCQPVADSLGVPLDSYVALLR